MYSIVEEGDEDDLELEDEDPGLGSHNNHDECIEGPHVLEVAIGQASVTNDNPVEPLQVKPLKGIEFVPIRGTRDAAGLDVKAAEEVDIPAGQRRLVPLGIACRCPRGSYIRIAPRSGMSYKQLVDVGAGVVD